MLARSTPRGFEHYNLLLMTTSQSNTGKAAPAPGMLLAAILFTGFGGGAYAKPLTRECAAGRPAGAV